MGNEKWKPYLSESGGFFPAYDESLYGFRASLSGRYLPGAYDLHRFTGNRQKSSGTVERQQYF